jgi:hypothetical protein
MDVEPLGEDYVVRMCHTIEDPTFDATAATTNPRARVRPIHRPPRISPDKRPHCAWTVNIDDAAEPLDPHPAAADVARTQAATLELDPIDLADAGRSDYSGPILSDIDFAAFSHSALVRLADEVCLQMHLLNLGFRRAVDQRCATPEQAREVATRQLIGHAGIAAERLHRLLGLPSTADGALRVLAMHPLLNPVGYVSAHLDDGVLTVSRGPANEDGAWISLCGPTSLDPLRAVVRAINPRLDVEVEGTEDDWSLAVVERAETATEMDEVAVVRFSTGTTFEFEPRRSLPLTVL